MRRDGRLDDFGVGLLALGLGLGQLVGLFLADLLALGFQALFFGGLVRGNALG